MFICWHHTWAFSDTENRANICSDVYFYGASNDGEGVWDEIQRDDAKLVLTWVPQMHGHA